jgi:protein-S-isoprenylcysteine O-methyltransferase Ste14
MDFTVDWSRFLENVRYIMGVLLVISLPPAIIYWFIIHPFVGFWRRVGAKWTFVILGVFLVGSMIALLPVRDRLLGRDLGTSLPLILAALPLLVISTLVSRKRRRYLTFRTLAGVPEVAPQGQGPGLLQEGIYSRIRHPRYVEFALGCVGWALFCNYTGLYIFTAATLVALYAIVLIEEKELRQRFGQEYVDYSARVPRFVPRWR